MWEQELFGQGQEFGQPVPFLASAWQHHMHYHDEYVWGELASLSDACLLRLPHGLVGADFKINLWVPAKARNDC